MRVQINSHGCLCIEPALDCGEYCGVEVYALRKWLQDNPEARQCHMRIQFGQQDSMEGSELRNKKLSAKTFV